MTEREKLHKKTLLLNYAERIGMEVLKDYGSWMAVGFPLKEVTTNELVKGTVFEPVFTPNRKVQHGQHQS